MKTFRIIATLTGCALLLLFLLQNATAGIEKAGLSSCAEHCEHASTENALPNPEPLHCSLHCFCHSATLMIDTHIHLLPSIASHPTPFTLLNETAPDGPVFGIDYPPQLS